LRVAQLGTGDGLRSASKTTPVFSAVANASPKLSHALLHAGPAGGSGWRGHRHDALLHHSIYQVQHSHVAPGELPHLL
jgi:hypothetical protein